MNQNKRVKYKCLDWLRCIGVCLIVYDHLGPLRNPDWFVAKVVGNLVNTPLGLIQFFGAFGVCLFFLISGFCLSASAADGWHFMYNKVLRILVPLLVSTFLFYCFNSMLAYAFGPTYWSQWTPGDWFESSTLLCYLFGSDSVINGATWYLFPLMAVYLCFGMAYRLNKKNTIYFVWILDVIFAAIWVWAKIRGFHSVHMQWLVFMLVPSFGILIRAICDRRISVSGFVASFVLNYIIFLENITIFRPEYYFEQPYFISLAYAVLVFSIFLLLEDKLVVPRSVEFLSKISFSLYLLHMPFGGLIMSALDSYIGFTLSFSVAVGCVVLLALWHYTWIEKRLAGRLKLD